MSPVLLVAFVDGCSAGGEFTKACAELWEELLVLETSPRDIGWSVEATTPLQVEETDEGREDDREN